MDTQEELVATAAATQSPVSRRNIMRVKETVRDEEELIKQKREREWWWWWRREGGG